MTQAGSVGGRSREAGVGAAPESSVENRLTKSMPDSEAVLRKDLPANHHPSPQTFHDSILTSCKHHYIAHRPRSIKFATMSCAQPGTACPTVKMLINTQGRPPVRACTSPT